MLRLLTSRSGGAFSRTISRCLCGKTVKIPGPYPEPDDAPSFRGMEPHFPCLAGAETSPEPKYSAVVKGYQKFHNPEPFVCRWGGILPELRLAYETWGELNESKSNVVLLHTGLSGSSHAKSHAENPEEGWWEDFIGPGRPLDPNQFYIVCVNNLGGCYGSQGPSSINPTTKKHYAMTFPLVTVEDMVRSQFLLLDYLGIEKLHAAVGASLGGMQSLMSAALFPERVGRVVSISACARTHPQSIALRYCQRRILMSDPNWNSGNYYQGKYPFIGIRHAREVGTFTYRSGPEWVERFGHRRRNSTASPNFCPDFEIEHYLEHAGEKFSLMYDPNSLLYLSKAMDLFDLGDGYSSLLEGVKRIECPVLILGVHSDVLFPVYQQVEAAELLRKAGNSSVTYYEINSVYGHDTFLLDLHNVGVAVKGYLESSMTMISK
eukprot:m.44380 g.44380  ORF g.44380 m.44380 type:complete len:434 (+) comp33514_c0_seq1:152-1453(+)